MVLKLYSGQTYLRTIYNVLWITQNDPGCLIVRNKLDGKIQYTCYLFNKDYNRFTIEID